MMVGTALDWYMTLHLSSPGPASVLTPGWYVTPADSHDRLIGGVDLNDLNTWDVDRLGWVKVGLGGRLTSPSMDQLSRYFVPRVESCVNGVNTGHFTR